MKRRLIRRGASTLRVPHLLYQLNFGGAEPVEQSMQALLIAITSHCFSSDIAFFLALLIGSFLNVVIYRLPRHDGARMAGAVPEEILADDNPV